MLHVTTAVLELGQRVAAGDQAAEVGAEVGALTALLTVARGDLELLAAIMRMTEMRAHGHHGVRKGAA
jgi:hypothetical protein